MRDPTIPAENVFPVISTAFWMSVVLAIALPAFFNADAPPAMPSAGLPRIHSGDEPHYLLLINSVLNDGDVDLGNNYASVHHGGTDAGQRWSGIRSLDHQTSLPIEGELKLWQSFFDPKRWLETADGSKLPVKWRTAQEPPRETPEYSIHQPGIAFLLAPVLYPFRHTGLVEPLAIFCSLFATWGALLFFRMLVRTLTQDSILTGFLSAATFLGTPIWHYSRSLFLEPYLLLFTLGSYALTLAYDMSLIPGILLALGIQLKPHIALLAIPLFAYRLHRRELRQCFLLAMPMIVSVALLLFTYYSLYGSPFTPPQPYHAGNIFYGMFGLVVSAQSGLLFFAPIIVLALACWPSFLKKKPAAACICASGFIFYFLFIAAYDGWQAGYSFGPRHLMPILPLLCISMVMLPRRVFKRMPLAVCLFLLTAASISINALGAFYYPHYWSRSILPARFSSYLPQAPAP